MSSTRSIIVNLLSQKSFYGLIISRTSYCVNKLNLNDDYISQLELHTWCTNNESIVTTCQYVRRRRSIRDRLSLPSLCAAPAPRARDLDSEMLCARASHAHAHEILRAPYVTPTNTYYWCASVYLSYLGRDLCTSLSVSCLKVKAIWEIGPWSGQNIS